jgi:hypothetical protein
MTHGTHRKPKFLGKAGDRLALAPSLQDYLPDRDRNRSWHEIILRDFNQ